MIHEIKPTASALQARASKELNEEVLRQLQIAEASDEETPDMEELLSTLSEPTTE